MKAKENGDGQRPNGIRSEVTQAMREYAEGQKLVGDGASDRDISRAIGKEVQARKLSPQLLMRLTKGAKAWLDVDGKSYLIEPLDRSNRAEMKKLVREAQEHLAAKQRKPIAAALDEIAPSKDTHPEEYRLFLDRLADRLGQKETAKSSRLEVEKWLDSDDGQTFRLVYQLRKHYPEVTEDVAWDLVIAAGIGQADQDQTAQLEAEEAMRQETPAAPEPESVEEPRNLETAGNAVA